MRALRIVLLALLIHGCVRIAGEPYQDGDEWCTPRPDGSTYCEPLHGEWEVR